MSIREFRAGALFLLGVAGPLWAQYPLAPSPVLRLTSAIRDPSLSGYLSVRQQYINDSSSFVVNRARLTLQVRVLPHVSLRIQTDLSGLARSDSSQAAVVLTDAYVQLSPTDTSRFAPFVSPAIIAGQFRTPFSLEFLTSFSTLQSANRSEAVNRLAPRRDIGVMGQMGLSGAVVRSAAIVNGGGPTSLSMRTNGRWSWGGPRCCRSTIWRWPQRLPSREILVSGDMTLAGSTVEPSSKVR
ncbi:MAG: porin [Gemmatimonadaceae bacterium]